VADLITQYSILSIIFKVSLVQAISNSSPFVISPFIDTSLVVNVSHLGQVA